MAEFFRLISRALMQDIKKKILLSLSFYLLIPCVLYADYFVSSWIVKLDSIAVSDSDLLLSSGKKEAENPAFFTQILPLGKGGRFGLVYISTETKAESDFLGKLESEGIITKHQSFMMYDVIDGRTGQVFPDMGRVTTHNPIPEGIDSPFAVVKSS